MDIISILKYFGITPSSITPLAIIGGIVIYFVFQHTKPMRDCLDAIKNNVTAISSFLSTTHKNDFPASILKTMSPYQIQKEGYSIIEESGLKAILDSAESKANTYKYIDAQFPKTKLDVERYSFMAFNIAIKDDMFNPVKVYLYNHPDKREFFPYLAAVYIRDMYLMEHQDIRQ